MSLEAVQLQETGYEVYSTRPIKSMRLKKVKSTCDVDLHGLGNRMFFEGLMEAVLEKIHEIVQSFGNDFPIKGPERRPGGVR